MLHFPSEIKTTVYATDDGRIVIDQPDHYRQIVISRSQFQGIVASEEFVLSMAMETDPDYVELENRLKHDKRKEILDRLSAMLASEIQRETKDDS